MTTDDFLIHDFFLFRHCVRSTAATFDDLLPADDPVDISRTTTKTTKQILPRHPDWSVPTNWCTETGLNITQAVGRYLMSERLLNNNNNNNNTVHWHIQFIADAKAHRDVDTAWALAQGMKEAVMDASNSTKKRVTATGLDQIYTEKWLFSGCQDDEGLQLDTEQQLQAVLDRLATLPPPPDFPIQQALDTIAEFLSDEEFQHLNLTNAVMISNSTRNFVGSVDFIKTFAQMAFYSLASNIPFELYNRNSDDGTLISRSTIYKLLQYVHWSRSITSVDVPFAAYVGAIHATTMLAALRDGTYYPLPPPLAISQSTSKSDTTHQHRATILTGHDTDLDALATVLGGRWILRPPYISGGDAGAYLPTPPLAALHARHHVRTGIVQLQFLYPVYSVSSTGANINSNEWVTNTTGVLEATAILGTPFPVIGTFTEVPSLDALEEHMRTVLAQQYPGADRCYQAGLQFQQTTRQQQLQQQPQPNIDDFSFQRLHEHIFYISMILSVVLLCVMAVGGLYMWRRYRPRRSVGYDTMMSLEANHNAGADSQLELA